MAQTPEGRVKHKITNILKAVKGIYYFMPVPSGYGESSLDYLGSLNGKFFAIEAKKPGGKPTDRQEKIIALIERSGGAVFVIDGDTTQLEDWIRATTPNETIS